MEFNQILELIDHVSASELTAFTYETADLTLSMEHGKPQIIQGVMGETVENIPAVGMTGGKVRRAVNTAPVAGKDPVVPASTDEMAVTVTGKTVAEAQGVKGTEQSETVPQSGEDQTGSLVTSPLVGTFYAAPSQDLPPYVQVGDKVKKGQVLAIVEAMKLMNEIERRDRRDLCGERTAGRIRSEAFPYPISTFRSESENKKNYCFRRIENEAS